MLLSHSSQGKRLNLGTALKIVVTVILPLSIGCYLYLFSRSSNPNFLSWVGFRTSGGLQLPYWVTYNLPDGLWLFALCNMNRFIWLTNFSGYVTWSIITLLLAFITELFQKKKFIPGTYDTGDLIAYAIAFLLALLLFIFNQYSPSIPSSDEKQN